VDPPLPLQIRQRRPQRAAESVYAVFEVKASVSREWLREAGEKAASVRGLKRRRNDTRAEGDSARVRTILEFRNAVR
jgi:hypothetical protein